MCIAVDVRPPQLRPEPEYELEITPISSGRWDDQQMGQVKDVMTWNVSVVSPRTTLQEALYLFNRLEVEVLVVYDGRTYLGILTCSSLDQMNRVFFGTATQVPVREVMCQSIEPASPDDPLLNVYRRMRQTGNRCLPVVDTRGKLAGLLTTTTIEARIPSLSSFSNN